MTFERTKLRADLVVSRQETRDGVTFVVKDPETGRFFRFGEAEHYITQQLDGETPAEAIQRGVEQKFGSSLSSDTLRSFLENLRRLGLLDLERTGAEPPAGPRKRSRGGPLYLRLAAFDPDRLLNLLANRLRLFFTPYFVVFSAAIIFLAVYVAFVNWGEIHRDIPRLYRVDTLLLVWLTVTAVIIAHEFAHGLTCKHFGGEVHEMGLLLLYFQPTLYCNVSEAWLLPKKSQRLWVTFAGAYFELFLCALATLAWRLVEPDTWLNWLALVVMATSGIKVFFNLNPLIKLDGYYLLSDYLEIPNLRSRSFTFLRSSIKGLWPGSTLQEGSQPGSRERRIYLIYGLLAGAYSYWLLGLVSLSLGNFLTSRYQGLGLVLFTAFLLMVFQNSITGVLRRRTGIAAWWSEGVSHLKRPARVVAILATVLAVLYLGQMELKVSAEFKILPVTNAEVRAGVEGIIDEIYVEEGHVVNRGDPIARLADRDLRAELQMTEATIAEKAAKLKMLTVGTRPEEIELAGKAVETAKTRKEFALSRYEEAKRIHAEGLSKAKATLAKGSERLKYAGGYLENARLLFAEKLISKQEMEKAQEEVAVRDKDLEHADADMRMVLADDLAEARRAIAVAEKEHEEAQSNLKLLQAGSRPEELEVTRAEISNREAERRHVREQMQLMKVMSPISGVVTTPKLKERIGQLVPKGDLIATVHDLTIVTAEIVSPEKEIADVKVGQRVALKARAYPGESFEGKVTTIAPIATKEEQGLGERNVLVSCRIDNRFLLLKPEMSGRAKIYCGQRQIIDVLTRRIARYIRIEFWSWW